MYDLFNNIEKKRYEFHIGEFTPSVNYRIIDSNIFITHTIVPQELRGDGVASKLLELVLQDLSQQEYKVFPRCSFVKDYIKRHPEWETILSEDFKL